MARDSDAPERAVEETLSSPTWYKRLEQARQRRERVLAERAANGVRPDGTGPRPWEKPEYSGQSGSPSPLGALGLAREVTARGTDRALDPVPRPEVVALKRPSAEPAVPPEPSLSELPANLPAKVPANLPAVPSTALVRAAPAGEPPRKRSYRGLLAAFGFAGGLVAGGAAMVMVPGAADWLRAVTGAVSGVAPDVGDRAPDPTLAMAVPEASGGVSAIPASSDTALASTPPPVPAMPSVQDAAPLSVAPSSLAQAVNVPVPAALSPAESAPEALLGTAMVSGFAGDAAPVLSTPVAVAAAVSAPDSLTSPIPASAQAAELAPLSEAPRLDAPVAERLVAARMPGGPDARLAGAVPAALPDMSLADALPDAAASALPPPPAPPAYAGMSVLVMVPEGFPTDAATSLQGALISAGFGETRLTPGARAVKQTQVRYYHAADAEAAGRAAEIAGARLRDFTDYDTLPPDGTIELWLAALPGEEPTEAPAPKAKPKAAKAKLKAASQDAELLALRDRIVRKLRNGEHLAP